MRLEICLECGGLSEVGPYQLHTSCHGLEVLTLLDSLSYLDLVAIHLSSKSTVTSAIDNYLDKKLSIGSYNAT